jgi:pilus assembly protein CpaB
MSRTRRGILLVGLALVLGGLAAADIGRREAAVARRLAPLVAVVVAREDLEAGAELAPGDLAVRRIPLRYAPAGAAVAAGEVVGGRLAAAVVRGGPIGPGMLATDAVAAGAPVRRGERAVPLVATGSAELISAGTRVDVLVTRDAGTELALQDVEVLTAAPAADAPESAGAPRVAATLRVTVRQAVYLAAAQSFARDIRLLPRATGDRGRTGELAVGEKLR